MFPESSTLDSQHFDVLKHSDPGLLHIEDLSLLGLYSTPGGSHLHGASSSSLDPLVKEGYNLELSSFSSGTLDTTDPTNPTRTGSFRDDYLLTGVTAGQSVQLNLNSSAFNAYLQVVDAATGQVIAYNDDFNGTLNSQLNFTAQAGIDYIVRATSFSASATGDYSLVSNTGDLTSGTPISANQSVNGTITNPSPGSNGTLDTTDPTNPTRTGSFRDDYLLTGVTAGQSVQLNLNSTAFDADLQVVNAATGQVVVENDNFSGTNSQLSFTTQAGVEYIVRATSSVSGATGTYSLTTNNGNLTSATPITGSQTFSGTLVSSDPANSLRSGTYYDGYLLTNLTAGQGVQVNLNSTAFDTYLQLVNAATGQVLQFDDDSGPGVNSQLAFTVQEGVDYLIRATSYSAGITGNYTLTTQTVTLPEGYNINYGYGLVNAAAAVAGALEQSSPFAEVPNLGGNNWGNDMINAPEVWTQGYTGQGVVVAVIDSGVDINHEDLRDNIWRNTGEIEDNGIDDDGNGYIDDINGWNFGVGQNNNNVLPGTTTIGQGHGTHVAGTIAAMNNNLGATGIAYNAQIMAIRMGDVSAQGYFTNSGNLANAIRYAVDNGARVINMSLGWSDSTELGNALAYAASHNVVVVSAAGNEAASSPGVPATYATQHGIAVGAVNSNKAMASFSNRAGLPPLDYVVAPGVGIYSTLPNNTYASRSGTSMASPHVAGVAALMLSANPNLTAAQVEDIITQSATRTGITV
jgi:hypothetical protein